MSGVKDNVATRKDVNQVDRSSNLIFFGMPEENMRDTRDLIDEICEYLTGKPVGIKIYI